MELTINETILLIGGILALGTALAIYIYFNSGTQLNVELLIGLLKPFA